MKDFIEELMYMCSSSNTESRGFYMFITGALVAMILGAIAMIILLIINVIKFGAFSPMWAILLVVDLICLVGTIIWLKKS